MDKFTVIQYYTPFIVLVWLTLVLLCILVWENDRIKKKEKGVLYITYLVVAIAALAEYLGLLFNGNTNLPLLLKFFKFVDYVLTPVAGGIIVLQFKNKFKIFKYIIFGLLGLNFIFQVVCVFTDWMTVIDSNGFYQHGSLYTVYIVIYFLVLLLTIVEFGLYGQKFRRHNRISLYAVLLFVITGVVLQLILNVKTAYLAITIGLAILFIRYSEFSQIAADDKIQEQKILITVDPLTGILNRYAYEKDLSREENSKDDFVVFSIDINGLKRANDSLGHKAGDELICAAAQLIGEVFDKYGRSYRTGGDEFIALSHVSPEQIDTILEELDKKVNEWHGKEIKEMSLSAGAASRNEFPGYTVDELVATADQRMYKKKSEYYISHGIDRRRR